MLAGPLWSLQWELPAALTSHSPLSPPPPPPSPRPLRCRSMLSPQNTSSVMVEWRWNFPLHSCNSFPQILEEMTSFLSGPTHIHSSGFTYCQFSTDRPVLHPVFPWILLKVNSRWGYRNHRIYKKVLKTAFYILKSNLFYTISKNK